MDEAFKETVDWYESAFVEMEAEREEMLKRFLNLVVPRELKDVFYLAVARELENHGIVDEKRRKKRKGDIGELPEESHDEL